MRWFVTALALAGCDAVFDLERLPDAARCKPDDEDCDQQPNATDICPFDADAPGDDLDGDRVGNLCDPDPTTPGNHITMFDPFLDNARGWVIRGGTWTLADGAFRTNAVGDARLELAIAPTVATPSVAAILDDISLVDNGTVGTFGASGLSELRCLIGRAATGEELLIIDGFALNLQAPLTGTGPVRLEGGQLQDGRLYCRAHHGNDIDVQVVTASISSVQLDRVGLITSSGSATYRAAMLLDVP